ncbi:hypothetical protein COO60DRAFT_1120851 [Scenedesmus sp. NREL 46B-D3]|nr:hypothetical protein COO60DRAFT_1120851 [Scenedesmus sp. NREL 46B-D3]
MRSTRVAAAVGAAAAAAGLPRNLEQAMQWLQHIKSTPVADLDPVWEQRAEKVRCSLSTYLEAHDALGRLPSATEQQLLTILELLCATIFQLLRQAPDVAPKCQQPAGWGSKDEESSCSSSSDGRASATDPDLAAARLVDMLSELMPALTQCIVCLDSTLGNVVQDMWER